MEHISKVLGNLDRETPIQTLKIYEEPEPPVLTPEEKREELRKSLGVASLDNTLENFRPVKGTGKALAAFKSLASGKTRWKMLLCYGGVGNGKTHLCEGTVIALYKRRVFCRVMTMARMMRSLKRGMNPETLRPYEDILEGLCALNYMVVDDVGMGGSGSEWEWGQLEEIIVGRYREKLFTILTSNLDIKFDPQNPNVPFIPERIVSRFSDPDVGRIVLNEGQDYRRLKVKK